MQWGWRLMIYGAYSNKLEITSYYFLRSEAIPMTYQRRSTVPLATISEDYIEQDRKEAQEEIVFQGKLEVV